jgi:hypothetical protein
MSCADCTTRTRATMEPRWQANAACLGCHQSERGQMLDSKRSIQPLWFKVSILR